MATVAFPTDKRDEFLKFTSHACRLRGSLEFDHKLCNLAVQSTASPRLITLAKLEGDW
jgi:hypothetical protein